ncbi:rho guanine nucleotide exchange factor 39 isoform X2 [Stigmatopora nigra]
MSFSPCPPDAFAGKVIQEQRDRWERKRSQAGRELVLSEQRYCQQLDLVITYFVEILEAKGTLKQDIRERIFSSIKAIHSVNQSLLVHLESGHFGRGFEQFFPQLHHYSVYVDNIHDALKLLWVQRKRSKAFRRFKELQEARPEFRDHKLEDLLQLPIERIHRYKVLLQEMTANTSPDNPEFQQLSRMVAALDDMQQRIWSNSRRHQNHLQLRRVQKLLKGSQSQVLAVTGRWYIREGWLNVVPAKGSNAKARMFFLFSDMLLQAKPRATNGQKFAGEHAYPLRECTVERVFGNTQGKGGLLSLTFAKAKLLLMSSDPGDFSDWYTSLSSAVRKLRPESTLVLGRENRDPGPLGSAPGGSGDDANRKRNMVNNDPGEATHGATSQWESSAPKRIKEDAWDDSSDASTSTCVLL